MEKKYTFPEENPEKDMVNEPAIRVWHAITNRNEVFSTINGRRVARFNDYTRI